MNKNVGLVSASMDEVILLEDEAEDQILAKALEESLRHYREVELPRLSQQADFDRPGTSRDGVQNYSSASGSVQISKEPILYTGKDAEGFDMSAGHNWIYPTNYPIRQYQHNIVESVLFKNTLVSLPTGLGKTFIAAVVMYNFYRWFPRGKVIFMAPTKPLVHQQIDSCYKIMGIPKDDTAEMTGNMSPSERAKAWETKQVFFLTPQVLTNDLTCGACPAASIKCVVIDEAHKAVGNHAYCQVIKALLPFNKTFRVLALSATPGSDMQAVMQVINNLLIAHVELRNEESPDIAEFTHKRNVETVVVSLGPYLSGVQERYLNIADKYLGYLQRQKVLFGNMGTHTKFGLLQARDAFRKNPPSHIPRSQNGNIEASFAVCVTLLHSLELLTQYGLRSFLKFLDGVLREERGQAVVQGRLKHDVELEQLLAELREQLGTENQAEPEPDVSMAVPTSTQLAVPYVYSHPKLENLQEVVVDHFRTFKEKNIVTRAMIFCQYRDTVIEVCHILQKFHPLVKPMTFVGQSSSGKSSKGFTQKQQLMVMHKFRAGGYNTLISTCVGEEGLDIGEVDLIVCFDAHKSPIRLVQRMGRTGRKREGRIVMLITEGKEHSKYKSSMYQNRTMNKKLLGGNLLALHLYGNNPRMIPQGINPQCHELFITVPVSPEKKANKRRNQDIRKLFGRSSGNGESGNASPYCTDEDLADMEWDGKFIPDFNMLMVPEEMHAKNKRDLQKIFNDDLIEETGKLNLGEWLEWQRDFQSTTLVKHGIDSSILVELLDYADKKRCDLMATQATGLLSQVNTSTMWMKKKNKGKGALKQKTSKSKSKIKKGEEAAIRTRKDFHFSCEIDGEGNSIADYFRVPAPVTLISKTTLEETENIDTNDVASRNIEVLEIPNDITNITNASLVNIKETRDHGSVEEVLDGGCVLCKNGLFDCHFLLPYTSSQKYMPEVEKYEPVDLSCIENITREYIIAFDVKQLIPLATPTLCQSINKTDPRELDSKALCKEKCTIEKNVKVNFDLDFSLDQCLFDEESEPCEAKYIQTLEKEIPSNKESMRGKDNPCCDIGKIEQVLKPEDLKEDELFDKIEHTLESSTIGVLKAVQSSLSGKDITPEFSQTNQMQQLDKCIEYASKPGTFTSPISPILCTQKSAKHHTQKSTRKLPMSSTPKVHRKSSVSKKMLEEYTKVETKLDSVMNKVPSAENKEENLVHELEKSTEKIISTNNDLPPSKLINLPTLNFDLITCTQLLNNLDNLDEDVSIKNDVSNKNDVPINCDNTTSNTSLCSVTQFLNMVDKMSTSSEKVIENVNSLKCKIDTSLKIPSPKNKINIETKSSSVMSKEVSVSRKNSNEIALGQVYFHDSDDDMFADLPLDTETDVKDVTLIQNEKQQGKNETLKASTDIKTKSIHVESNTIASPHKDKMNYTLSDSHFPSFTIAVPGIERLNSPTDGVQSDNMVSKLHLNLKCKPNNPSIIYSNLQSTNLNFVQEECPVNEISQKISCLGNKEGKPSSDTIVTEITTKDKVKTSVLDSQFSPLTTFVSKVKALPLNENVVCNTSKSSFRLKDKPKITSVNYLEGERATVVEANAPVVQTVTSNMQRKVSVPYDERDNSSDNRNVISSSTPKRKNDLLFDSHFMSPITVVPGIETTYRTLIFDQDMNDCTTKCRLSLKRKHKTESQNHSNPLVHKTESINNESISSPRVKKAKLDGHIENKCFKTPEKYCLTSVKRKIIFNEKKESEECLHLNTSIGEERPAQCNKVYQLNTKSENEAVDCQIQISKDVSPVISNFVRKKTADISPVLNSFSVNKLKSFTENPSSSTLNENKIRHYEIPVSQDDSPIIRPCMRKKTANISSTTNESAEGEESCMLEYASSLQKNLACTMSISSEENNNSRILSNSKVKNKLQSKTFKSNIKSTEEDDVILISSDDSDFESHAITKQKKMYQNKNIEEETHKKKKEQCIKSKQSAPHCVFLESEAEESGICPSSSDGEDTSGLDDYDSSFVSESGTQPHAEDIQVKFLNSIIRSPGRYQGKFKIPKTNPVIPLQDVYSQTEEEFDNSYEEDSFCVDEELYSEMLEDSILEVAEAALEAESKWKRRKRKRKNSDSDTVYIVKKKEQNNGGHKKRRRILMMSFSDSEDDERKSSAVKNIGGGQSQEQFQESSFHNPEKEDCIVQLRNQCSSKAKSTNNINVDHMNPGTSASSKPQNTSAKDTDLNFSDWDFDNFAIPPDVGVTMEQEKSDQITPHQNRNEVEQITTSSPTDKCLLNSDLCNFELADLDELVTSPVLSYSGRSKHSGRKAVRSLKSEFDDEITVLSEPQESSPTQKQNLKHNNEGYSMRGKGSCVQGTLSMFGVRRSIQNQSSETTKLQQVDDGNNRIVMMATRQVASAPEVATALRAVHKVNVLVRSFVEADYVISWRLGVLRVALSDFMRACPKNSPLANSIRLLRSHFMKHVLIIENDKQAPLATSKGIRCEMWSKHSLMHISYLRQAGIHIFYSCDKGDTARLVARLSQLETEGKQAIKLLQKNDPESEIHLQFYHTLPNVNIALAMRMCYMFPRIIDFIDRCNTVKKIQEALSMDVDKAARIYLVLRQTLKPKIT